MKRPTDCLRCSGQMEPGFLADNVYGAKTVQQWVSGRPEKSIWTGLKMRGRTTHEVETYRCRRCGRLESYA